MEVRAYREEGKKNALEQFLESLKDKNDIQKVRKLIRLLEIMGFDLGMPVSKNLGEGLFELRDRARGLRLYYCFYEHTVAVLLLGGDKSSQDSDIKKARSRRNKLKSGEVKL